MTRFDKWVKDELKELCEILDLDKKGSKVIFFFFPLLFSLFSLFHLFEKKIKKNS